MQSLIKVNNNTLLSILKQITERAKVIYGNKLKQAVLFGSYARGDYDSESDVDIMLLIDDSEENIKLMSNEIIDMTCELSIMNNLVLSVIEIPYARFEYYKEVVPFYLNIENEGVLLYGG